MAEIRGLTLWRPWDWAIAHAGKRIENRDWRPPDWLIGGYIAIHGGKTYDDGAAEDLLDLGLEPPLPSAPQGIVAVARLVYCFDGDADELAKILGPEEANRQIETWLSGDGFGWVLSDVVAIPTVPCRGNRGLWPLPADVLAQVRQRWKEASSRA